MLKAFATIRSLTTEVHPRQEQILVLLAGLVEATCSLVMLQRRGPQPELADSEAALCVQVRAAAEQAHATLLPLLGSPTATVNPADVQAGLDQSLELVYLATDLYARVVGISEEEAHSLLLGRCNPFLPGGLNPTGQRKGFISENEVGDHQPANS